MAIDQEKNILVDRGIPMLPDLGSSDRAAATAAGGSGSVSSSGWSVSLDNGGGRGAGPGGSGLGPGRGRRRGITNKQAKRLLRQEQAQAKAQAEAHAKAQAHQQAILAHQQLIESLTNDHGARRNDLDRVYAQKSAELAQLLESEIRTSKKPPARPGNEPWQLYLINKEKSEIDGIIASKESQLSSRTAAAASFDSHNPLARGVNEYRDHIAQYGPYNIASAHDAHRRWEDAYIAAHEAKLLSESIKYLTEKSQALTARHAEAAARQREIDAIHEGHRRYEEKRGEQIKHRLRIDEDSRRGLVKAANTVVIPNQTSMPGSIVLSRSGAVVANEVALGLEAALKASAKELVRVLLIRAGQIVSVTATALVWSEDLGNGELTPEQRRKLFQGINVGVDTLGLAETADLTAIAQANGTVNLPARIKAVPLQQGVELHVVSATSQVPVIEAALDPLTGTYKAQTPGPSPKYLSFDTSLTPAPSAIGSGAELPEILAGEPQVLEVPAGVDARIHDCIVCFPAALGWPARYFTFYTDYPDSGVVKGDGQIAAAGWWQSTNQKRGAAIPAQVADVLREREFTSQERFEKAVWKAIAQDSALGKGFDELNHKRMARGHAPYAPKSSWAVDRREFELRFEGAPNESESPYDLDRLTITRPNNAHGVRRTTPTFLPWPVSSGSRTWTPLAPPGKESVGATELPVAEQLPNAYQGTTTDPVESHTESHPAVDPLDLIADIPGYGEDDDLPSPDLVFAGPPVEPLEVGPYNELSGRSRLDGLDIDHIASRQALKRHITNKNRDVNPYWLNTSLLRAPSIAIPAEVHRKLSQTYGGRNTVAKQIEDARDLRAAVDKNLDAIKPGLLEAGFDEQAIEAARQKLHALNNAQGWYQ